MRRSDQVVAHMCFRAVLALAALILHTIPFGAAVGVSHLPHSSRGNAPTATLKFMSPVSVWGVSAGHCTGSR